MNLSSFVMVSLAVPIRAQTTDAPTGWPTQTRAKGVTTFTPPDLQNGEIYNIAFYPASSTKGKSSEAYLREKEIHFVDESSKSATRFQTCFFPIANR